MQQAQMEQQAAQQQDLMAAKEDGANYRKELDVAAKTMPAQMAAEQIPQ
jgi:hypothetical protein